jgi:hypothetical protein
VQNSVYSDGIFTSTITITFLFIPIDVVSMGRFSAGSIFSSSVLAEKLNKHTLQFPPPALLPNFEQPLSYVFVGDEVFPLSNNLVWPYPKKVLQEIRKKRFQLQTVASTATR